MNETKFGAGNDDGFEELLTIADVAKALKISEVTVRRIISKNELSAIRVGQRHVRISPTSLRAYVSKQAGRLKKSDKAHPQTSTVSNPQTVNAFEGQVRDIPWKILQADALYGLRSLKDKSVDCIVTSPPYYWQRDYGYEGQIGHEPTIDGFVHSLRDIFSEARRVLKTSGTLFLNIGDTYYSAKGKPHGQDLKNAGRQMARKKLRAVDGPGLGLPRKSLIGIPWRVALALQQDGWTLRSNIIWDRPGSLGEPTAKDRPWRRYEHIFMFSRAPRYYFDRTGLLGSEDIWSFPARPDNPNAHFAPYPRELVQRCLSIGCPPGGTVLDPFVGSGTTMIVALEAGHPAIGIDLSSEYCAHVIKWITSTSRDQNTKGDLAQKSSP